jgi:thiol:disulfide interchange protein DsbA
MTLRRAILAFAACAVTVPVALAAGLDQVGQWRAGTHYDVIENPRPPATAGKVEVIEFFWYGCSHCFALDPELEKWNARKPEHIAFSRTHVIFEGPARQHAKLYYTLLALGRADLHGKVFDAIHVDGRPLFNRDALTARRLHFGFLANFGITQEQFDAAYDSAEVAANLKRAEEATLALRVATVPTLIVNGKYSTSVSAAGGPAELLSLLEALAASENAR